MITIEALNLDHLSSVSGGVDWAGSVRQGVASASVFAKLDGVSGAAGGAIAGAVVGGPAGALAGGAVGGAAGVATGTVLGFAAGFGLGVYDSWGK